MAYGQRFENNFLLISVTYTPRNYFAVTCLLSSKSEVSTIWIPEVNKSVLLNNILTKWEIN